MNARERLIELLEQKSCAFVPCENECHGCRNVEMYDDQIEAMADHLLANGVVVVDTNIVSPKNRPLISQCLDRPIDEIIELVNAKDEGRILVLPCKVGDTVYVLDICARKIIERKVTEIRQMDWGTIYIHSFGFGYPVDLIGKTVFLSRELAEKALAERSKNG